MSKITTNLIGFQLLKIRFFRFFGLGARSEFITPVGWVKRSETQRNTQEVLGYEEGYTQPTYSFCRLQAQPGLMYLRAIAVNQSVRKYKLFS
ncbi:MAG: hypothetical protein F6K47_02035 [Symploca sp. SIO2E6]|nr:hypothetical protein [Symploca sp. SIO2E6]